MSGGGMTPTDARSLYLKLARCTMFCQKRDKGKGHRSNFPNIFIGLIFSKMNLDRSRSWIKPISERALMQNSQSQCKTPLMRSIADILCVIEGPSTGANCGLPRPVRCNWTKRPAIAQSQTCVSNMSVLRIVAGTYQAGESNFCCCLFRVSSLSLLVSQNAQLISPKYFNWRGSDLQISPGKDRDIQFKKRIHGNRKNGEQKNMQILDQSVNALSM